MTFWLCLLFAAELDTKISETQTELEKLREDNALKEEEIAVLKTAMSEKDEESQKRQSMLEERLNELERLRAGMSSGQLRTASPKKRPVFKSWCPIRSPFVCFQKIGVRVNETHCLHLANILMRRICDRNWKRKGDAQT